jgi:sugar phosphate isomerase/epimerase
MPHSNTNATPACLSRRTWLRLAAIGTVAAAAPTYAIAPIKRTGGPCLKIGLNVYSFLELLKANAEDPQRGIDLFAACEFAARQNIDAVDLTGYFFPGYPDAPSDGYIARIKRHVHDLGLFISGTGVRNDFATADKAVRAEGVQLTKKWIEVAARLGAPVIRVFAGPQKPFKQWQDAAGDARRQDVEAWMADCLRDCAEHGAKFGVIVAVQNHADFLNSGTEHLSLLERVNHPWCGPLVDTGKYLTTDPYDDIATMAPYAVNWQIKETLGSTLKSPRTDFNRLVKIIYDSGYRGYLPIETLAMGRPDYDPFAEVTKVVVAMREALASVK